MITAGMATIAGREDSLKDAVDSLMSQGIDRLYLYFNDYEPPLWAVDDHKIITLFGPDEGDMGKFRGIDKIQGVFLVCDDDLIYPPDYVRTITDALERYKNTIVSFHGSIMMENWVSYYRDRAGIACLQAFPFDVCAHVLGTGVLALNTNDIDIKWKDPENLPRNMSDVHLSAVARRKNIPLIGLAHEANWLIHTTKIDMKQTIWHQVNEVDKNDSVQSGVVRSMGDLRYFPPPASVGMQCIQCGLLQTKCYCVISA